jgi:hypothetical protein
MQICEKSQKFDIIAYYTKNYDKNYICDLCFERCVSGVAKDNDRFVQMSHDRRHGFTNHCLWLMVVVHGRSNPNQLK